MTNENNLFSATGIPSLFLIFGVLMLVILSLLGYSTSRQDQSASALSLKQTTAYYDACTQATDLYTDMVRQLKELAASAGTEDKYYQLVGDYFATNENIQWNSKEHTAEYMQAFSETQSLMARFSVLWTDSSSFPVEILTWNTVVTADWNPDNSQSVYKGE